MSVPKTLSPAVLHARNDLGKPGERLPERLPRDCYFFLTIDSGRITVSSGTKEERVGRGGTIIGSPECMPTIEALDRARFRVVAFTLIASNAESAPESARAEPLPSDIWGFNLPPVVAPEFAPRFSTVTRNVVSHTLLGSPSRRLDASMHCGALLCEYAAWLEETRFRSLPREAMIEHAERVALKSLDAYMDVRAFAAAAGFGPSRFHEVYHAARGITPYRFLLNARMERARALLFETELDIATIASQLGYADASTFGRVFRRIHGVTPSGWRDHAQSDVG